MVAARGNPEQNLFLGGIEDRCAHGDIGQMRAAVIRCIDHVHVAGCDRALVLADNGFHGAIHGAEMDGHMRSIRHQRAIGCEYRTREIEPLLDVDRIGRVLQRHAHLFGNRHEQVVEHFEHHRIGRRADRALALERNDALDDEMVLCGNGGAPAVLHYNRLMRLNDNGRAVHLVTRRQLFAQEDGRIVPCAAGVEAGVLHGGGKRRVRKRVRRLHKLRPSADCLD